MLLPRPLRPVRRTRRRLAGLLAVLSLAAASFTGCGADGDDTVSVVAGFYPLQYIGERLTGREVTNLTKPGTEPHDLELSVSSVADISKADLVLHEDGMQPAVDKAVEQNNADAGLDISKVARLRHTAEGIDPHFWMDPQRMSAVADEVAERLQKLDSEHAAAYADRLADLQRDLRSLTRELRSTLDHCRSKTLVVSHEAFGYWGDYGMKVLAIGGLSPEVETSPAKIQAIADRVRAEHIPTVYGEDIVSSKAAQTVATETGVDLESLTTIESPGAGDDDYLSLMRKNIAAVARGNHCGAR